jgi:hypothetical protein
MSAPLHSECKRKDSFDNSALVAPTRIELISNV